jgi:hypothetical protein
MRTCKITIGQKNIFFSEIPHWLSLPFQSNYINQIHLKHIIKIANKTIRYNYQNQQY